ncbi:MAG: exodeoxyribonuclease VII small subunit [Chloroflexi bacterium]|nr:exodeoxyribonuclease VII small subunit [Chloroflexota bacterium]
MSAPNWRRRMDNLDSLDFEQAFTQLQDTVRRLEAGDLPLEESVSLYETGRALAERCQKLLDGAELRVRKLDE